MPPHRMAVSEGLGLAAACPDLIAKGEDASDSHGAGLQLFLHGWVRARAIAIYLMVFLGTQAVAAPISGLVTQHAGLQVALLAAAAALVGVSVLIGQPETHHLLPAKIVKGADALIEASTRKKG